MSKKSHPGDGSHGKGARGNHPEFDELFQKKSRKKSDDAPASAVTQVEPQQEAEDKDGG